MANVSNITIKRLNGHYTAQANYNGYAVSATAKTLPELRDIVRDADIYADTPRDKAWLSIARLALFSFLDLVAFRAGC